MADTVKYLDLMGLERYNELLHNEINGKTHTVTVNSGKKADGSTDISATSTASGNPSVTLADSGVTAGEYGPTSNQTPTYGATFNVPDIKVNAKGIVTSVVNRTVLIPTSDTTDTATAADNILDGSNNGTLITYAPYETQLNKLSFDISSDNPTGTSRLNLNGKFYATEVYSEGAKVLTSHQDISGLAPKASPALTGTPTAPTAAAGTSTTQIATTAFVQNAISGITDAMVFIGSIGATNGTISAIPTTGVKVGHTYKIVDEDKSISAANSATGTTITAKVGDTIVATDTAPKWVVIPSGDEPSGTVTSVAITNGDGITVSGGPITSSGTLTVGHADTSSQASVTNSGRTYIQSITLDGMGHVTAISSASESVVNTDHNQKVKVGSVTFGDDDIVEIKAGTNVTSVVGDASAKTITINTKDTTYESKEAANGGTDVSLVTTGEKYAWNNKQAALAALTAYASKGSATKVPQITTNELGQVTNISEVTITQPTVNDSTFSIKTKVGANNTVVAADFTANLGTDDDLTLIQGDNITLTTDATNRTITIAATLPTVNNGTLTLQGNSTQAGQFTANQSGSTTVNFVGSNGLSVTGVAGTITVGITSISYGSGDSLDNTKDIDKLFI